MTIADYKDLGAAIAFVVIGASQWFSRKRQIEQAAKSNRKQEEIHTLVNSNMTEQKRLVMIATRRLAEKTKDKSDVEEARLAKQVYEAQLKNQDKVNKGK
jgi:poly-D-alanine transfer protein DltD